MSAESHTAPLDFTQVVERYTDFVYNVALRMTGDPHQAQDATQDTFIAAYKAYPRFRAESQVRTWLYRITVNAVLMQRRKERKSRELVQGGVEERVIPDWSDNPERAALDKEVQDAVQAGLATLPEGMRMAVVLRDVQGLSGEEAAEALGIQVATLKTRLHRGRLLLRTYLAERLRAE